MKKSKTFDTVKMGVFLGIMVLLLGIGLYFAIVLGAVEIGLRDIWKAVISREDILTDRLIWDVRIPRALCVLLTGGVLGVMGTMIQGVTRNPVAEPSLLGVSQAATFVVACFYAAGLPMTNGRLLLAAGLGAALSGALVIGFTINRPESMSLTRLLLAGTALSTFFLSLTTIAGLLSNRSQMIAFWVSGGFRNASWSEVFLIAGAGIPCTLAAIALGRKINIVSLGDDVAVGLGEHPGRVRTLVLLLMIPMCAASVAVGRNVPFVGLIVPQTVRLLLGNDYRRNMGCSFLAGAVLLTFADIAARMLYSPYETPIGIFTALLGIPFFILLAKKERR